MCRKRTTDDTQVVGNILVRDNLKTTRDIVDGNGLMNHKLEWLLAEVAKQHKNVTN